MKVKLHVGIYGMPPKLNLDAKILYGNKEQYESKIFRKSFSLDEGGDVTFDPNLFNDCIKQDRLEEYSK